MKESFSVIFVIIFKELFCKDLINIFKNVFLRTSLKISTKYFFGRYFFRLKTNHSVLIIFSKSVLKISLNYLKARNFGWHYSVLLVFLLADDRKKIHVASDDEEISTVMGR